MQPFKIHVHVRTTLKTDFLHYKNRSLKDNSVLPIQWLSLDMCKRLYSVLTSSSLRPSSGHWILPSSSSSASSSASSFVVCCWVATIWVISHLFCQIYTHKVISTKGGSGVLWLRSQGSGPSHGLRGITRRKYVLVGNATP